MISQLRQHRSKNFQSQIFFVSKAVSPSLDDTNFVVQSLDKSQRHFVLRSAVSRNTLPMTLNHLGKFLKRSEPLPFECCLPVLKEAPRPPFALIAPQLAKGLFEQVSDVEPLILVYPVPCSLLRAKTVPVLNTEQCFKKQKNSDRLGNGFCQVSEKSCIFLR